MSSSITPPSSVQAAGIVAIIGGCFGLLGAAAGLFFLAGPYVFYSPALGGSIAFCAGVAVFGFVGGPGLLRMQNWARIATLTFAGLIIALSVWLLFSIVLSARFQVIFLFAFLSFDIVPLGISIWRRNSGTGPYFTRAEVWQ